MSTTSISTPPPSPANHVIRHRTNQQRHIDVKKVDDADVAAGQLPELKAELKYVGSDTDVVLLSSSASIADLEGGFSSDESVSEQPLPSIRVLGFDISHMSQRCQFLTCACGVFAFSLLYGYLQELIAVQLCSRQLGLFLAMVQFSGYAAWSFLFRFYIRKRKRTDVPHHPSYQSVPIKLYLGLSVLRAIDLAMTNVAMQYVNYPAKTLMKSSRVVFTMLFGVLVARKKYRLMDYFVVMLMVSGLAIFMHADASSSAVFQPLGIIMLTVSLLCDGAISNVSETIMTNYNVCQDEFIFNLYSISLVAISAAAAARGDLRDGISFLFTPGTLAQIQSSQPPTWGVASKVTVMLLFSTTGFFGSSCSAAITKHFGALTMSITSTARKATTLFLSFALFNNVCTLEHVGGIVLFITSLIAKSLRASKSGALGRKRKVDKFSPMKITTSPPPPPPPLPVFYHNVNNRYDRVDVV